MTDLTHRTGGSIAYEWWRDLHPDDGRRAGSHRATLARLRRAATPIEVMQEPAALRLIERLPWRPDRAAIVAGVLAYVRETEERTVARAIGRESLDADKPALVSEGRFRRLLQAREAELMDAMRRLARMSQGKLNVRDLANAILYWGDTVKKRWIFDYYGCRQSWGQDDSR